MTWSARSTRGRPLQSSQRSQCSSSITLVVDRAAGARACPHVKLINNVKMQNDEHPSRFLGRAKDFGYKLQKHQIVYHILLRPEPLCSVVTNSMVVCVSI